MNSWRYPQSYPHCAKITRAKITRANVAAALWRILIARQRNDGLQIKSRLAVSSYFSQSAIGV